MIASNEPQPTDAQALRIAGRYVLRRPIGNGKLSTVYLAEDRRRDNEFVAVKLLNSEHPDELRREFFRRETSALQSLNHPNIIRIREHGWSNTHNCFYLVFDYFEYTLSDYIARGPEAQNDGWCRMCMSKLAEALVHAHSEGIIHRDIKPNNILIDDDRMPRLTDFGTSKLKYELATGTTLAPFWSAGYAAPEQRDGSPGAGDERSDIYALGAVYYHLLSRIAPPSDGPSAAMIDALGIPPQLRCILRCMLTQDPQDRYSDVREVCRDLDDAIATLRVSPQITIVATEHTRRELCELGAIKDQSFEAARIWLTDKLGGDNGFPVPMLLQSQEAVVLLVGEVRITCVADRERPAFFITEVETPWGPDLEAQKAAAKVFQARWKVVRAFYDADYTEAQLRVIAENRSKLLDMLAAHGRRQSVKRDRRVERKSFIATWDKVLRYQRDLIDKQKGLPFGNAKEDGGFIIFTLQDVFPDTYDWPIGAVVAVDDGHERQSPVGTLASIAGATVVVGRDTSLATEAPLGERELPRSGLLSLYRIEERAAIKRQQDALAQLQASSTANPRLMDVLIDPSKAECDDPDTGLEFVQQNLAPDKQAAVREALAVQDLYLLQGPPGTGKTTAITEIILQILAAKLDARILVSSQSNVAVNHVLSCVAEYYAGQPLEIVRMGRDEKIGQGAQAWSLDHRVAEWRQEVVKRCDIILDGLKDQERKLRQQVANVKPELDAALTQCAEWMAEADPLMQRLRDDKKTLQGIQQAVDAHQDGIDDRI